MVTSTLPLTVTSGAAGVMVISASLGARSAFLSDEHPTAASVERTTSAGAKKDECLRWAGFTEI